MDDPFETKTPEQQRQTMAEDAWHREQARKAHDIIRVTNPLEVTVKGNTFEFPVSVRQQMDPHFQVNGDYLVEWDGLRYRVPLGGTFEIDRYIAQKFCREMCTAIINYYGLKSGEELLKIEGKNRPEILLDKFLENQAVWDKVPRTDDVKLTAEIWGQLWLGLVRENGLDIHDNLPTGPETDFRSPEEKLMEQLANKRVSDDDTTNLGNKGVLDPVLDVADATTPPLYISKATRAAMEKEVTNED